MARLTIVIPAVGDQASLDDTLLSVLENRPADCQVLIAHPVEYQDPYELSDEVDFVPGAARAKVVELLQVGCRAAVGTWIHWMLPGVMATPGWTDWLENRRLTSELQSATPRLLGASAPDGVQRIVADGVQYRPGGKRSFLNRGSLSTKVLRAEPIAPSLWAGFVRRSVLSELDGWNTRIGTEWADVDLGLRLADLDVTCPVIGDSAVILHSRSLEHQVEPQWGFRSAWRAERFYRAQQGSYRRAVRHLVHVVASSLTRLPYPAAFTGLLGSYLARWASPAQMVVSHQLKVVRPDQDETTSERKSASTGEAASATRRRAA
ncbi:MAG: hypothetical protein U0795_13240 [Pirellulales bacterium]